jgi:recombinational DNA repair protein RecT
MTSTAIALRESPLETPLGQIIAPYQATLAPFLRDGVTLERVAAELVLASRKTPNLDRCVPAELVDAVCRALQTGGTIGTDVYIVPFFSSQRSVHEPTVMLDYKFKVELVVHAGGARSIDARPVWSDEMKDFAVHYGSNPRIEHTPSKAPARDRKLMGAYSVAFLGYNHAPKIHWMPIDEIEAIRKKSKQWNPEKVKLCPGWYACARTVHQIVKLLPKNAKLRAVMDLMEREEREEFGEAEEIHPEPMQALRPASVTEDGVDLEMTDEEIAAMDTAVSEGRLI